MFNSALLSNGGNDTVNDRLYASLEGLLNTSVGGQIFDVDTSRRVMAMENFNQAEAHQLRNSYNSVHRELVARAKDLFSYIDHQGKTVQGLTAAQEQAAVAGAILASNKQQHINGELYPQPKQSPNTRFIGQFGGLKTRSIIRSDGNPQSLASALEAYDERANKDTVLYSIAYNMQAARQDDFAEAFFPTVTVMPDQYGYTISVRQIMVLSDFQHTQDGKLANGFKRRNLLGAYTDPTILTNDTSNITPVYLDEAKAAFVDTSVIATSVASVGGESITTAPLAMGASFNLLGLSQTAALLKTGYMDQTDAIDPVVQLKALYFTFPSADGTTTDVIKADNLLVFPGTTAVPVMQGNAREMTFQFQTKRLLLKGTGDSITTDISGNALKTLAAVATVGYNVNYGLQVSGRINVETGDTSLFCDGVTVYGITDVNGNDVDMTTGSGLQVVTLIQAGKCIGYDLKARRTLSNRRQRGQLLETVFDSMVYAIPLLSPITVARPQVVGDNNDASDINALITATNVRASNDAVAKLIETDNFLYSYVNTQQQGGVEKTSPEIFGAASFLLNRPWYERDTANVQAGINSLTNADRWTNMQEFLVNKLRDQVTRAYRDSGYKVVLDQMNGGAGKTPTVIIGTDPVIYRWLMVTGDFRTLGNGFEVKLVQTQNQDMRGKIFWSFGEFGAGKEGVPNPMHFGNFAFKPELTIVLPMIRNGASSKELTVTPSYLHIVNLPIMGRIDVVGLSEAITLKTSIDFHSVS